MRRFDVISYKARVRGPIEFVIVLQAEGLETMPTIIAAPIRRGVLTAKPNMMEIGLCLDGSDYVILVSELAALPKSAFGDVVSSAAHLEWEIGRALDRLLFGV